MTTKSSSLSYTLDTILAELGSILEMIRSEANQDYPKAVPLKALEQVMNVDSDDKESILIGALSFLYGMGLICTDARNGVRATSREASFALGSLSKFFSASLTVPDETINGDGDTYLVSLTKALESVRERTSQVDNGPIHSRRIVNVLIKSRQIRHWQLEDVYLHVYHPQWKEYHLIGLSHKDDSMTDKQLAQLALEKQAKLLPDQYTLDPVFNPREVTIKRISATNGALASYTIRLIAIKEIRVPLNLEKCIENEEFDQDWFRWFTWEEIRKRRSEQGEPIMFSTPLVMENVDLEAVPVNALQADDVRRRVGILNELGYRFTRKQLITIAGILLCLPLLRLLPLIPQLLNRSSPLLDNLANIAEIGSFVIPIILALGAALVAFAKRT